MPAILRQVGARQRIGGAGPGRRYWEAEARFCFLALAWSRAVATMVLLAATAQAASDPFAGTWILDVQRSQYPVGTCPAAMTIEMESDGRGVRYRSDTIFADGRESHSEYTADYEGNQAIVMGARGMTLPVFLKRADARTVVASYTKGLVVVATSLRVVSEDGRTMTITTESKDSSGKSATTIGVFARQEQPVPQM